MSSPLSPELVKSLLRRKIVIFNDKKSSIDGDENPVCRMCYEYVEENSSYSNRYMIIQGGYTGEFDPEGKVGDDGIAVIPICDKCYHGYNIADSESIEILGKLFLIDCVFRGND